MEGNENEKAKGTDRCSESEEFSVIVDTGKWFPLVTISVSLGGDGALTSFCHRVLFHAHRTRNQNAHQRTPSTRRTHINTQKRIENAKYLNLN